MKSIRLPKKEMGILIWNPETKTPTTNSRRQAATTAVGNWKASRYSRHRNAVLTKSSTCRQGRMI